MSTVPSGTRFIGISERVNLTERKSAVLNSDTQAYTIQDLADTVGIGAQGPQGVQGPAGPLGPVGPAGLNWQGAWVSGTSYVADDAVGYGGASYFCILATSGTTTPNLATTNWALLASQGAQGIQGVQGPTGPQGPAGSSSVSTRGTVAGGTYPNNETVLPYDINIINVGTGNLFKLPNNAPLGKEIIIDCSATVATIYPFSGGGIETAVNGQSGQRNVSFNDLVKFTSYANNYWLAESLQRNAPLLDGKDLSNGSYWSLTWISNTTSPLSLSTLNSTWSNASTISGFQVFCPSIIGGGLVYTKTGAATWVSQPITVVT